MKPQQNANSSRTKIQQLTASQVSETVALSGLSRQDFAESVGCGTSQLYKYQQEGLPPRMNKDVRANILQRAMDSGVVAQNAAARAEVQKLAKGRTPRHAAPKNEEADDAEG